MTHHPVYLLADMAIREHGTKIEYKQPKSTGYSDLNLLSGVPFPASIVSIFITSLRV
jgi:hypothetical protein